MHLSIGSVVEGMREVAFDYVLRPCDTDALAAKIHQAFERGRSRAEEAKRRQVQKILEEQGD